MHQIGALGVVAAERFSRGHRRFSCSSESEFKNSFYLSVKTRCKTPLLLSLTILYFTAMQTLKPQPLFPTHLQPSLLKHLPLTAGRHPVDVTTQTGPTCRKMYCRGAFFPRPSHSRAISVATQQFHETGRT